MEWSHDLITPGRCLSCESLHFCGNSMDLEAWNFRNRFDIILLLERGTLCTFFPSLCLSVFLAPQVQVSVVVWWAGFRCQTHWQLAPYGDWIRGAECLCIQQAEAGHPLGSERDQNQLSCSWKCSPRLHFAGQSRCLWFGFLVVFVVLFWIFLGWKLCTTPDFQMFLISSAFSFHSFPAEIFLFPDKVSFWVLTKLVPVKG